VQGLPDVPSFMKKSGFRPREYQLNIYSSSLRENTLVVLPTGLGKTVVAAMVAARRFQEYPDEKILVLAPTRPLAEQHLSAFRSMLDIPDMKVLTGEVDPELRKWQWNHSSVLFMTPQALRNDLEEGRYDLSDVCFAVFDEAHHAVGDYPYVYIAARYVKEAKHPLIMGLTASPGHTREHMDEVLSNLFITHVEARDEKSPDVAPYVKGVREERVEVTLPTEMRQVAWVLESLSKKYLDRLSAFGIRFRGDNVPTKYLLNVQQKLRAQMESGERDSSTYLAYGLLNNAIRVRHAKLLLEVEGVSSALAYMEEIESEAEQEGSTRSLRALVREEAWTNARHSLEALKEDGVEHPKVPVLRDAVRNGLKEKGNKVLVFAHYRETARVLSSLLQDVDGVKVAPFMGQAARGDEKGMSQKDQMRVLEDFREGLLNVLVATQVAEEGLDIENCDLVIFYDNVPSAIRLIQRRGRTGRKKEGRLLVLVAKGTADESYHWISVRREGVMDRLVSRKGEVARGVSKGKGLEDYVVREGANTKTDKGQTNTMEEMSGEERRKIEVDQRLRGTRLLAELSGLGVSCEFRDLGGEYIKVKDAVVRVLSCDSVMGLLSSGSLFEEAIFMKTLGKPVFIVEGNPPLLGSEEPGPRSSLMAISLKYGVPFIPSLGPRDSALYIWAWASREDRGPRVAFYKTDFTSKVGQRLYQGGGGGRFLKREF